MYCRICGARDEDKPKWFTQLLGEDGKWVERYPAKGWQLLCRPCAQETPDKVTKEEFEASYWRNEDGSCGAETVPPAIRKEFYSDYLASTNDLESYCKTTVSEVE